VRGVIAAPALSLFAQQRAVLSWLVDSGEAAQVSRSLAVRRTAAVEWGLRQENAHANPQDYHARRFTL
jgi:hypothetical protein